MPYSHHSHSGQFCGHAKNTLEEVIQRAIELKMQIFALTEHMPRQAVDFYPEESDVHTVASLAKLFDDYYAEATRLREKYGSQINLLLGFESEWIRPESLTLIQDVRKKYHFDFFVGSVHHVHTIPIDFDKKMYEDAVKASGGSEEQLFADYFDSQYEMLQALKPVVVGHFDLIRLFSDQRNAGFKHMSRIWEKVLRNLNFVAGYGGILELNSAGLRKGLDEPYPCMEICKEFMGLGGRFTLSDDSHGIDQVATNYGRLLAYIEKVGIEDIAFLQQSPAVEGSSEERQAVTGSIKVAQLKSHPVWGHN